MIIQLLKVKVEWLELIALLKIIVNFPKSVLLAEFFEIFVGAKWYLGAPIQKLKNLWCSLEFDDKTHGQLQKMEKSPFISVFLANKSLIKTSSQTMRCDKA